MNKEAKFWIGVACKEHVENGLKLGICQFSHGKSVPAKRLSRGDFVIYYSSKVTMGGAELSSLFLFYRNRRPLSLTLPFYRQNFPFYAFVLRYIERAGAKEPISLNHLFKRIYFYDLPCFNPYSEQE